MTDSSYTVPATRPGISNKDATPAGGLLSGRWKGIEPLYIWSALVGLLVAFLLIGLGMLLQSHALH
jgi:hypothetical protein